MSNLIQNKKVFRNTMALIILAEILSFLGYYYPPFNWLIFLLLVILTITASLYRLEYGLYILLTELFIGSFGYLFSLPVYRATISIRMALWLITMSVWLAKTIIEWLKTKKPPIIFCRSKYRIYLAVLSIFIIWGLVRGLLNGNSLNNIFFDFDRWLYFLLIFPVFSVWRQGQQPAKTIKQIFIASITWLSLKTILLAYFFSHNFAGFNLDLYRWIRQSGVGEITPVTAGFSRIFLQSHIFVLIGIFILSFYLLAVIASRPCIQGEAISQTSPEHGLAGNDKKKLLTICFLLLTLLLSAILISFSRSFWLGLSAGLIFLAAAAVCKLKINFKKFIIYHLIILCSLILAFILILLIIKFPYPAPGGGFNAVDLISQRATQLTNEAGAASRWQLLPPLWQKIKIAPLLGGGFGSTVTYKTDDPRVIAANPTGLYTTYAFEWGWLDVWLKLGLFGLLAYLALFIIIIKDGWQINSYLSLSLAAGLIVLIAVNIFSPYINHPLGIGYIVMAMVMIDSAI